MEYRIALVSINDGMVPEASYGAVEHLGLAYLAASLRRAGYTVKIIDAYALRMSIDEVLEETVEFSPHLLGATAEYNTFPHTIDFCCRAREAFGSELKICLGGEHATFASEEILAHEKCIDLVVRGEGDWTIVEVADRLSHGESFENVAGVFYRDEEGAIRKNRDRPRIEDLDSLPFPARDTLEEALRRGIQPAFSILTSRGCQFNCSFCNASKFFNIGGGKPWRARSAENVLQELESLFAAYDSLRIYPLVYFLDEIFVGPGEQGIQRVEDIARAIIESDINLSFEIFCRSDSFNNRENTVRLLKRSGLTSALLGLESGVQGSLDIIGKRTTVAQNLTTLQLFRKHNIITSSSGFIMFNPYSEPEELLNNADFLRDIGHATLYNMSLKVLLYPGIRLANRIRADGLLKSSFNHFRVDHYRFVNPVVARVVEAVESVDFLLVREEDATIRHIDMTTARIRDIITDNGKRSATTELHRLDSLLNPTWRVKDELGETSHRFFVNTVGLASNGWDDGSFQSLKAAYLEDRSMRLTHLNSEFQGFLKEAEELL